jgi:molecular chaperone GrpE
MSKPPELPPQGHLLRLTMQVDRIQAQLDRLLDEARFSSSQMSGLVRHLTDPATTRPTEERLAELLTRMEASQAQWDTLFRGLDDLTQTVTRLNRAQFKTNALGEVKEQQTAAAISTLQEIVTRREERLEERDLEERQRSAELRAEARGEIAADLLPALDGLELALESGRTLLERRHQQEAETARAARPVAAPRPPSLWRRWLLALFGVRMPAPVSSAPDELPEAVEAWLRGLELVRSRFQALLAAEGVEPIPAQGWPFDPRLHVALETELRADLPAGTVVTVARKGYRQRGRVLRYAEVTVSRAPEAPAGEAAAEPAAPSAEPAAPSGASPAPPEEALAWPAGVTEAML